MNAFGSSGMRNLDWIFGAIGSKLTKNFSELDLAGEGANGRMSGFYFTDGKQHLDHDTQQNHLAPHTTSDLLFKGALRGQKPISLAGHDLRCQGRRQDGWLSGKPQPGPGRGRSRRFHSRASRSLQMMSVARTVPRSANWRQSRYSICGRVASRSGGGGTFGCGRLLRSHHAAHSVRRRPRAISPGHTRENGHALYAGRIRQEHTSE